MISSKATLKVSAVLLFLAVKIKPNFASALATSWLDNVIATRCAYEFIRSPIPHQSGANFTISQSSPITKSPLKVASKAGLATT